MAVYKKKGKDSGEGEDSATTPGVPAPARR